MSGSYPGNSGYYGERGPYDSTTDIAAYAFLIRRILNRISTSIPVKVIAVAPGAVGPVGSVDVLPLVNQVDGLGNATPHGVIHGLPYSRIQGGTNAVIIDPKVGDIGIATFASHDISSVKANKAQSNPGSRRRFDWSDGMYIGGILNGTPDQYVEFNDTGINIVSPGTIRLQAPNITIHATTALRYDCDGNGTRIEPMTRDDYVIGSTNTSHALNPPEIP